MGTELHLEIVFIHFGGATSLLPTQRCIPASWFHTLLLPRPCRVSAGCRGNHAQGQRRGGRERDPYILAGGSVWRCCPVIGCRRPLIPHTHSSVSSSLVQNSWLLLLLLLARSHPIRVSLSHCQWCCASCVDLLPNQRTQGEEKTAAVEAVRGQREETLEIFSEALEWLRGKGTDERDANNDNGGRFYVMFRQCSWRQGKWKGQRTTDDAGHALVESEQQQ